MPTQPSATSAGEILGVIRGSGGLTRAELLEQTGMARSTLYLRLDQLQAAGLIRESGFRTSTGGRPAAVLAFDARDRVVLTLDVGHHRAAASVCDVDGASLASEAVIRGSDETLPELVEHLCGVGERLLAERRAARLMGVGLALPAPVDRHTGQRLASVALPDPSYPIESLVATRFGCAVSVENDARALALGVSTEVPDMDDDGVLLGVKFSTGLGLGLLTGGHMMRGSTGAAGDLGHLRITPGRGPECTCGRRGCLAAYASGRALVRDVARPDIASVSDLAAAYDRGEPDVVERVHAAARLLGTHVGGFVQVSNPQYVAFGGVLGGRPTIAQQVEAAIREQLSDRIGNAAEYRVANGDHTAASGLVALVVADALAAPVIDELLATG